VRIAVIGHVEHITLGRVPALPGPGDIVHLDAPRVFPGGGGGVAFFQLSRSSAEIHLFTALGNDDAGALIESRLMASGAKIHAARRDAAHTRDVVLIPPGGDRVIVVVGQPLHPRRDDTLPWDLLGTCDAVYFTAQDPAVLVAARAAKLLVVSARRREALLASGIRADVVVGSASDPREAGTLADFPTETLILTEGAAGGRVETAAGSSRFAPPPPVAITGATYGAGDSFAGALTYYLALGMTPTDACARAGPHGAAVLAGLDPIAHQLALP
jgi:ribokinase